MGETKNRTRDLVLCTTRNLPTFHLITLSFSSGTCLPLRSEITENTRNFGAKVEHRHDARVSNNVYIKQRVPTNRTLSLGILEQHPGTRARFKRAATPILARISLFINYTLTRRGIPDRGELEYETNVSRLLRGVCRSWYQLLRYSSNINAGSTRSTTGEKEFQSDTKWREFQRV